jgi:hypothetical protein
LALEAEKLAGKILDPVKKQKLLAAVQEVKVSAGD